MKKSISFILLSVLCILGNQLKGQVAATTFDISPLLIGETVPDGNLADSKGNTASFHSLLSQPAVVICNRGDLCPNCITHFST